MVSLQGLATRHQKEINRLLGIIQKLGRTGKKSTLKLARIQALLISASIS
ncbi:MAG: hypothetical protein QXO49_05755 [Candidatus Bathyarchaeia archaeon]